MRRPRKLLNPMIEVAWVLVPILAFITLVWLGQQMVQAHESGPYLPPPIPPAVNAQQERQRLMRHVLHVNPRVKPIEARAIVNAATRCGHERDIDPKLLMAVIETESHYRPYDIGAVGERGLMQITRHTAKAIGLKWWQAFQITTNVCAGAEYLDRLRNRYGTLDEALLHYNGGPEYPGRVMNNYHAIENE